LPCWAQNNYRFAEPFGPHELVIPYACVQGCAATGMHSCTHLLGRGSGLFPPFLSSATAALCASAPAREAAAMFRASAVRSPASTVLILSSSSATWGFPAALPEARAFRLCKHQVGATWRECHHRHHKALRWHTWGLGLCLSASWDAEGPELAGPDAVWTWTPSLPSLSFRPSMSMASLISSR
jgi:hypothetical protein